jgi:hypothetical protein
MFWESDILSSFRLRLSIFVSFFFYHCDWEVSKRGDGYVCDMNGILDMRERDDNMLLNCGEVGY